MFKKMSKANSVLIDELYSRIAAESGGISELLDSFFNFLHSKTDFYVEVPVTVKKSSMGFPVGKAEQLLLQSFRKYPYKTVDSSSSNSNNRNDRDTNKTSQEDHTQTSKIIKAAKDSVDNGVDSNGETIPTNRVSDAISNSNGNQCVVQLTPAGKQIPIGNGGVTSNYYWTQTLKDLTIYIDHNKIINKKSINCKISSKKLLLEIESKKIIDGELEEIVRVDECTWTISHSSSSSSGDRRSGSSGASIGNSIGDSDLSSQVIILLEKTKETWWKSAIVGDQEIDTTKVDSTKNINEYDSETQAAIRKIMFEQRQKNLTVKDTI